MQKRAFMLAVACVPGLFGLVSRAQSSDVVTAYIARYKDVAIAEMKRTGVPAAITLAQGIHETEAGTSELVRKSNNHFGIKCKDDWNGESVLHDDDARGECFRKYAAPEDSYRDHSDFLRTRPNYTSLFQLDPTDYEGWAYGLKKAGYATNPKYAQILIRLIQEYHLEDYTLIALGKKEDGSDLASKNANTTGTVNGAQTMDAGKQSKVISTAATVQSYPEGEFRINDTRVVYIKKGTSYLSIAQQYEIPLSKLFEFNEIEQQEVADCDQLLFIQRKRKTGTHDTHVVQPGETLQSIAQTEAIRLDNLLEYNGLRADAQPASGETLYLRGKSPSMPRLSLKNL